MKFLPSTFWELAGFVFLLMVSVSALKLAFSIRFDLNRWLERRREHLKEKIQRTCPHTSIFVTESGKHVKSHFYTSHGMIGYQCSRCGCWTMDDDYIISVTQYYINNPQLYFSKEKKLNQLMEKL